jgi:DnaJ-class molecular chaperone
MIVKEEGMPSLNDMNNGDLLINFDIVFPDSLEEERSKYLVKILPIPKKQVWDLQLESTIESNIIDKTMTDFNDKQNGNQSFKPQQINEINDEELFNSDDETQMPTMGGRQQVECATQ